MTTFAAVAAVVSCAPTLDEPTPRDVTASDLAGFGDMLADQPPTGPLIDDHDEQLERIEDELNDQADDAVAGALCRNAKIWTAAKRHIGSVLTLKGPVVSVTTEPGVTGSPTFITIGAKYPAPDRLTVVIWGADLKRFVQPPSTYAHRTICVFGEVRMYKGSPQVFVAYQTSIGVQ